LEGTPRFHFNIERDTGDIATLPTCPSTFCIRKPSYEVLSDALLSAVSAMLTMLGNH